MNFRTTLPLCLILLQTALVSCSGPSEHDYPYRPVPFTSVQVTDPFWGQRLKASREVTIPLAFSKCEETGRYRNFEEAALQMHSDENLGFVVRGLPFSISTFILFSIPFSPLSGLFSVRTVEFSLGFFHRVFQRHSGKMLGSEITTRLSVIDKHPNHNAGNSTFRGVRCLRSAQVRPAPAGIGQIDQDVGAFNL